MSDILSKINCYSSFPISDLKDVYIFKFKLCDNDIEDDYRYFSDYALYEIAELALGTKAVTNRLKTSFSVITSSPKIFDTEIVTDDIKLTAYGMPYKYVEASAFIPVNADTVTLISDIKSLSDIKVSMACAVKDHICPKCGKNMRTEICNHRPGKNCMVMLSKVTTMYEWAIIDL